jgi:hypothetical protein
MVQETAKNLVSGRVSRANLAATLPLAVVYCEYAKTIGMWLDSHGVSMSGLYYPRGVVPSCGKPRVSAKPFWMRLWVEMTVAVR